MIRRLLSVVSLLVACLALVAPAQAAPNQVMKVVGTQGTGDGQFSGVAGIAVNQGSGEVYVVDTLNDRVQRFDADGTYLSQFGTSGAADGEFSFGNRTGGIAIDQSDGSVYVTDTGNDRVQKFTGAGVFSDSFGSSGSGDGQFEGPTAIAVDGSGGVVVADTGNDRVQRFSSAGAYQAQFGTTGFGDGELTGPSDVAIDSTGQVYVLDASGRIQRFTAAGTFDSVFGAAAVVLPSGLAVNITDDHVLVSGYRPDFTSTGVIELDTSGAFVQTHADLTDTASATGVAVRNATGRTYASAYDGFYILDQVAPPSVAIDPSTDVAATTATLHGRVDPEGSATGWSFQYSSDQSTWTSAPAVNVDAGDGTTEVPVSQAVTGLKPLTLYHVRLVATKPYGAGTTTSSEETFTTLAAAPEVGGGATRVTGSETASLGGTVDANSRPTTYYFEYGPTTAYGSSVPTARNAAAGSAATPVAVKQYINGLAADTVYHYRLVAVNAEGTSTGPDASFRTQGPPAQGSGTSPAPCPGEIPGKGFLPDDRGWEKVSPAHRSGFDIGAVNGGTVAAVDGGAVAFHSFGSFADPQKGDSQAYIARRSGDGTWTTTSVVPPETRPGLAQVGGKVEGVSPDLSHVVLGYPNSASPLTPDSQPNTYDLYRRTVGTSSFDLLTPIGYPIAGFDNFDPFVRLPTLAAASDDYRHIVFESLLRLTPDAPADALMNLYEWVDGTVRLVGILPNGDPAGGAYVGQDNPFHDSAPGASSNYPPYTARAISTDGRRIIFIDAATGNLYLREDGVRTIELSAPYGTAADPDGALQTRFRDATPDGSKVLFTTCEKLTADSTAGQEGTTASRYCDTRETGTADGQSDLYLYDRTTDSLTDLSADPTPGGNDGVLGTLGLSVDGAKVYFAAKDALAPDAVPGQANVYLWQPGRPLRLIASLDLNSQPNGCNWVVDTLGGCGAAKSARVSADGHLLFSSDQQLTTAETGGQPQLYRYDPIADATVCVSCSPAGADSQGIMFRTVDGAGGLLKPILRRDMSDDGRRVFFTTTDAFVADDTNGKADVYVWEDGAVRLLSSGRSTDDSYFAEASPDGDDVFIATREPLTGSDTDENIDLYDARVGGGISEPPAMRTPCSADACQGTAPATPTGPEPRSAGATKPGDPSPVVRAQARMKALSAAARRSLAQHGHATITVTVSRPGRLSTRVRARLGRKTVTVARATKTVARAGTARLTLRLSSAARRELRRAGKLKLTIGLTFTGQRGSQAIVVTLKKGR